jgi:plastocyanin
MTRTARAIVVALVALCVLLPAAEAVSAPGDRGASQVHRVRILDGQFRPPRVTIDRGDRVRWVNVGTVTHTTTSDDGDWDHRVSPGDSFTRRFRQAGTFSYHCAIHPEMTGTIVVE